MDITVETLSLDPTVSESSCVQRLDFFPRILATEHVAAVSFLECIADLELFGARWILALEPRHWSADLQRHALDEVRHSDSARRAARGLRSLLSDKDLAREARATAIGLKATDDYLSLLSQRVFRAVRRRLGRDWTEPCYVLLSFLIERRLMAIYPHLASLSFSSEVQEMARRLIADEKRHLGFVVPKLVDRCEATGFDKKHWVELEESLAQPWFAAVAHASSL